MAATEEVFESADEGDTDSAASDSIGDSQKKSKEAPTAKNKRRQRQRKKKAACQDLKKENRVRSGSRGKEAEVCKPPAQEAEVKEAENPKSEEPAEVESSTPKVDEQLEEVAADTVEVVKDDGIDVTAIATPQATDTVKVVKDDGIDVTAIATPQAAEEPPQPVIKQPDPVSVEQESKLQNDTHQILDHLAEATQGGPGRLLEDIGSNIITAAGTISQTVEDGITSVLDVVDETLGIQASDEKIPDSGDQPTPDDFTPKPVQPAGEEETTASNTSIGNEIPEGQKAKPQNSWYNAWGLDTVLTAVQETGKVLVTEGLDALEILGKQTYTMFAEGEHGLKKALNGPKDGPTLSQLLQDAKIKAESGVESRKFLGYRRRPFLVWFDDHQGIVQLQALELLSFENTAQIHHLLEGLPDAERSGAIIKLCTLAKYFQLKKEDLEGFENGEKLDKVLLDTASVLNVHSNPRRLLQVYERVEKWLTDPTGRKEMIGNPRYLYLLHEQSMDAVAEFTAAGVHYMLQIGQLLLLNSVAAEPKEDESRIRAEALHKMALSLCSEIASLSVRCSHEILNTVEEKEDRSLAITSICKEANNCSSYLQESLRLLLPVLQKSSFSK